jgi:hypothetical protein
LLRQRDGASLEDGLGVLGVRVGLPWIFGRGARSHDCGAMVGVIAVNALVGLGLDGWKRRAVADFVGGNIGALARLAVVGAGEVGQAEAKGASDPVAGGEKADGRDHIGGLGVKRGGVGRHGPMIGELG